MPSFTLVGCDPDPPRSRRSLLTEQQQLDLPGRLLAVVPQIPVDHLAALHRRLVLRAQRASHPRPRPLAQIIFDFIFYYVYVPKNASARSGSFSKNNNFKKQNIKTIPPTPRANTRPLKKMTGDRSVRGVREEGGKREEAVRLFTPKRLRDRSYFRRSVSKEIPPRIRLKKSPISAQRFPRDVSFGRSPPFVAAFSACGSTCRLDWRKAKRRVPSIPTSTLPDGFFAVKQIYSGGGGGTGGGV